LSSFLSLWLCKCRGPVYGCVAGFLFGFTCSNPLFSAPLGISCLISAYLMTKSFLAAVLIFPVSSFFVFSYLFGIAKTNTFIPFVISGTLLYLAFYKKMPELSYTSTVSESKNDKNTQLKNSEYEKVSDSLSGLSSILYKFAEHMKSPGNAETGAVIDNAFTEVCQSCSMKNMCYAKRECNLPSVRSKIISILHSRRTNEEELSAFLLHKCIKIKELCNYINSHYSELHFLTMKSNRTQTVAGLYNSMSRLMRSTTKQESEKHTRDERLEKTLSDSLKKIGIEFSFVTVSGSRCKEILIHGIRPDKIPCSSRELSEYLSDECRIKLSEPSFDISDNADIIMKFTRDGIISIDYSQCCQAKENEDVNGDTVSFFENDKGFFYSIIADGMGSGKAAAATSRLSCVFLEKMLSAGTSKNVCIEMLNNLLLSKNDETFSGIDLLEIDRLSGSAYFIKAGAAPSFVLRKSRLYKICSETPPVGIIPAFSAESTRFSLEKGDVIIMVSDGVIESDADAIWLSELIGANQENEPAFLAKRLIDKSGEITRKRDDASACVIKIN
ncbi:MAG: SpoIIE family protein phosphatase, partial [Clostridia bacterium]|nr:SpoIIE family protein phosphatase [Clostridia bacterium]